MESRVRGKKRQRDGLTDELALEGLEVDVCLVGSRYTWASGGICRKEAIQTRQIHK